MSGKACEGAVSTVGGGRVWEANWRGAEVSPRAADAMNGPTRVVACMVLALAAGMATYVSAAASGDERTRQWTEAAVRQAQEAQRRKREARLRWEYERRRSAAHARRPNTLYASTPSSQAHADLSCPALVDEDTRRLYRNLLEERRASPKGLTASSMAPGNTARDAGINVFPARRQGSSGSRSGVSAASTKADSRSHLIQASAWLPTSYQSKSAVEDSQNVYLFPSASEPLRQGFVRVINHSDEAGEVMIDPIDDSGRQFDTITLSIEANETVHFNSGDLETGNEGKGLSGSTGSGEGDWRLAFSSDLDIEVLSYIRTEDGFLTAMHDVAPADGNVHRVAIFNPGSNKDQLSRLRLINPTDGMAEVTIRGTDDKGMPGTGEVSLSLDAGTAREISAEQLESGGTGLAGTLGDGSGKWRLEVESRQAVVAMSLLESPTDHLTNLSTAPELPEDGVFSVLLFPAAGDDSGRQGFVRMINDSDFEGEVSIKAFDETNRDYEALTLTIGANEVVHFNSDNLEQGSLPKGLSGGVGAGEGDWRLELTSDLDIEVLSYIRTKDGFLTAMHDKVPRSAKRHRVAVFNPGSNNNQQSLLRLVNPIDEATRVAVTGFDDRGQSAEREVRVTLPAGASRTLTAQELEAGHEEFEGALGDGTGKWRLTVNTDRQISVMSLLSSPTGHLTNLSTAPIRGAGPVETSEEAFEALVSPLVQSKCVTCHVEGGASGHTPLVFVTDSDIDHLAKNLREFENYLANEEDGAAKILDKIRGARGHGGGPQVPAGTEEYAGFEQLMELLGAEVSRADVTIANLFEGVTLESPRRTLWRAAVVFAGRIPTKVEYASIESGTEGDLRRAIQGLMEGEGFHEFIIRASNDRLLTDRVLWSNHGPIPVNGYFVSFFEEFTRHIAQAEESDEVWRNFKDWAARTQYGATRAPLELIAHVVEEDLPYTEILTADYVMANPWAAQAYVDDSVDFVDWDDVHEFKPARIRGYYRKGESYPRDYALCSATEESPSGCDDVLDTRWPHAGVLNTLSFLERYPTTATNRNRARSRWTYYHFLGDDIEKSAARTMNQEVLADRNNPTMNNEACTVCHERMDPVAGAFQNYGNEGPYRDQPGGMDSLADTFKNGLENQHLFSVEARSWEEKEHFKLTGAWLAEGAHRVAFATRSAHNIHVDHLTVRSSDGSFSRRYELETIEDDRCGGTSGNTYEVVHCPVAVPIEVPSDGTYDLETEAYVGYDHAETPGQPATLSMIVPYDYRYGDTWYGDMRDPGFGGQAMPEDVNDGSLRWLAGRIVEDERFAPAAVEFWWPSIMGSEVAEQPQEESDVDYDVRKLTADAQADQVRRLADGFRRGFSWSTAGPYNMKDLMVEIVMSQWFRATSLRDQDGVRADALRDAGARRLLTPEELARKTASLTGYQWGRGTDLFHPRPHTDGYSALTNEEKYRLFYGGIDSDGITKRGRDLTSVMAGVAQHHAVATSCPIVLKEFYILEEEDRRLFGGIDETITPTFEFGSVFEIEALSRAERGRVSLSGDLEAGAADIRLSFPNDFRDEEGNYLDDEGRDRVLRLDRLDVRHSAGDVVESVELEGIEGIADNFPVDDHFAFHDAGSIRIPVTVPEAGDYSIEVVAWADPAGDELAKLEIAIETDTERSAGSRRIRAKLVELHDAMLGVEAGESSTDVQSAFDLFVEIWERKRNSEDSSFLGALGCELWQDHEYYEGILDDAVVTVVDGGLRFRSWDWDRVNEFMAGVNKEDPHGVARTWVVVLAYLLMDYRYLYL